MVKRLTSSWFYSVFRWSRGWHWVDFIQYLDGAEVDIEADFIQYLDGAEVHIEVDYIQYLDGEEVDIELILFNI